MQKALKEQLVNYKILQEMKVVKSILRNAMGKSKFSTFIYMEIFLIKLYCSQQETPCKGHLGQLVFNLITAFKAYVS